MERRPRFCGGRGPHQVEFSKVWNTMHGCLRRRKNLRGTRHVDLDQRVAGSEAASLAHPAQGKFRTTLSPWLVPRFGGVAPSSERLSPGHEGLSWLKQPKFPFRRGWKNCAA